MGKNKSGGLKMPKSLKRIEYKTAPGESFVLVVNPPENDAGYAALQAWLSAAVNQRDANGQVVDIVKEVYTIATHREPILCLQVADLASTPLLGLHRWRDFLNEPQIPPQHPIWRKESLIVEYNFKFQNHPERINYIASPPGFRDEKKFSAIRQPYPRPHPVVLNRLRNMMSERARALMLPTSLPQWTEEEEQAAARLNAKQEELDLYGPGYAQGANAADAKPNFGADAPQRDDKKNARRAAEASGGELPPRPYEHDFVKQEGQDVKPANVKQEAVGNELPPRPYEHDFVKREEDVKPPLTGAAKSGAVVKQEQEAGGTELPPRPIEHEFVKREDEDAKPRVVAGGPVKREVGEQEVKLKLNDPVEQEDVKPALAGSSGAGVKPEPGVNEDVVDAAQMLIDAALNSISVPAPIRLEPYEEERKPDVAANGPSSSLVRVKPEDHAPADGAGSDVVMRVDPDAEDVKPAVGLTGLPQVKNEARDSPAAVKRERDEDEAQAYKRPKLESEL